MPQPNTNGLIGGGTTVATRGKWTMVQGTQSDLNAVTVQLVSERPEGMVSFLKLDHDLLHLLDSDRKLAVGNGVGVTPYPGKIRSDRRPLQQTRRLPLHLS